MRELHYHVPMRVEDAVALLATDAARPLSGGTDLIPQAREGRRSLAHAVDLKRIPELTAITPTAEGGWRIGAATTIGALGRHAAFAAEHEAVLEAGRLIGSLQVQNRASLGGNICNAAPSADAVPILICLGAQAEIAGASGRRHVPIAEVATGPGRTSLAPDEILVAIHLPPRGARSAARYLRFTPRREMDIAIAGAAAWLRLDAGDRVLEARIALASVGPVPLIAGAAQQSLVGHRPSADLFAEAATLAAGEARPISDSRGSAAYRRTLVEVLVRRTLTACAGEIGCKLL